MNSVRLAGAVLCGVLYCLAFAPFNYWPLGLLSTCGFFYLLIDSSRPVLVAWLFGVGKYGLGASWVYVSINVYGQAPPPLAFSLVALFVFGMALFCLPMGWVVAKVKDRFSAAESCDIWVLGSAAITWVLMDWLLTWFLTGFPWLFMGFAYPDHFLGSIAAVIGVLGLTALLVAGCCAIVLMVRRRRLIWQALGIVTLPWMLGVILLPIQWTSVESSKSVALVQGNLDQNLKWHRDQQIPNWNTHVGLTRDYWSADLIVWPEAAVTMFAQQAQSLLDGLDNQAKTTDTAMVIGIPGADVYPDGRYDFKNLGLGLGTAQGQFAKHHLVPFGDYVPLQDLLRGLIQFFDLPMSNATAGLYHQPNIDLGFTKTALAICYEIAYGESMRVRAQDAGLLMTISNDTWFGRSIGPHQHMQIAQMRARENGRWLVRATNNGVTGVVNPRGEITQSLAQFVPATLYGQVQVMRGRTPYSRMGDWPLLAVIFGGIVVIGLRYRKQASSQTV
ncbi:MAG: apolipoprotein N-acyltransferase [Pseudomonadota bacterium]